MKLKVTVDGTVYDVEVDVEAEAVPALGSFMFSPTGGGAMPSPPSAASAAGSENALRAPLAGTIRRVDVAVGDTVSSGQVLMTMEAMKMETEVTAPQDGTIAAIPVSAGTPVQGGDVLLEFE